MKGRELNQKLGSPAQKHITMANLGHVDFPTHEKQVTCWTRDVTVLH